MSRRKPSFVLVTAAFAALSLRVHAQEPPSLPQVLERLAAYLDRYASELTLVIGTERYSQEIGGLRPFAGRVGGAGVPVPRITRTLTSEFAVVGAGGDWLGFRDVYEVDGAPVRDRADRLGSLFTESAAGGLAQARRIADESARYNIGAIQRNFNTPTTALFFFQKKNQDRFRFKRAGEEQLADVLAWKLDYKETYKPTIIRTTARKDVPVSGTIWLDPADGRVLKTTLHLEAELRPAPTAAIIYLPGQDPGMPVTPLVRNTLPPTDTTSRAFPRRAVKSSITVTVTYHRDSRLQLLVPAEMSETYEQLEGQRTTGHATYSDFKRFETATKVIIK